MSGHSKSRVHHISKRCGTETSATLQTSPTASRFLLPQPELSEVQPAEVGQRGMERPSWVVSRNQHARVEGQGHRGPHGQVFVHGVIFSPATNHRSEGATLLPQARVEP